MKTHNELTRRYLDARAAHQELTVQQFRDEVRPRIERTIFQGNTLSRPGFLQRGAGRASRRHGDAVSAGDQPAEPAVRR